MKTNIFIVMLALLCNIGAKSQTQVLSSGDLMAKSQKTITDAVDWLYENFKEFDRECFLIGMLDDEMACQRIATFKRDMSKIDLALFVVALFKKDYPDLRALRVCSSCCPFSRHYGSEIKSLYDHEDTVCHTQFDIELFSSSLAKTVAVYYDFDYGNASLRVIDKEKIQTEEQKESFLAGIFMRYEHLEQENDNYSISIPNSVSAAKMCADILREFGCNHVDYTDKIPTGHQIIYTTSNKTIKIKQLTDCLLFVELLKGLISF